MLRRFASAAACSALLLVTAATATAEEPDRRQRTIDDVRQLPADNVRDGLDAEFRPAADRARDPIEKPEPMLRESGLARGMRVADLRAGDGYLAQILVAAIRHYGRIWANNDPASMDLETSAAWKTRLEDPSSGDIARSDLPLAVPLPDYAFGLDIVYSRGAYHDAVARSIDRKSMNKTVFESLLPGGRYVVVDARADDSAAPESAAALCRVPESLVRSEVEAAGFHLVNASTSLREKADSSARPACGERPDHALDRVLLIFEKPGGDAPAGTPKPDSPPAAAPQAGK